MTTRTEAATPGESNCSEREAENIEKKENRIAKETWGESNERTGRKERR